MFNMTKNIAVWGDSVLKGIIYDAGRHKYKYLERDGAVEKMAQLGMDVKNNAKFGMTAPKARKLMLNALEKGVDADMAILEFGGNDCDFKWADVAEQPDREHQPNTTLEVFKNCIADMVQALRNHGITPILMNLPPIHSEKYFNWISKGLNGEAILKWLGDKELIYRHHESYSLAIMNLSIALSCDLIDVRQPFLMHRDYYNYLCEDGIHPNEQGHEIINQTLFDFARSKLIK
ncbi:MAG TPA: SGNH/GDSL hydrolase family protein [Ruminiclostridium sp.]|jgi:lysophospholipase L1-like esterase|nr:SGNH/GDSL hydrolase family protein [Ruminiclostridium sp.]